MTGYQADSFVAFEVPTTSKWNKIWSNLAAFYTWITNKESGWISAYVTWTYASATTFTISGDYSGIYRAGDKIRLKQGGAYKYFYIVGVSFGGGTTTITITGGSSYTLTNAAITDNYYAKESVPNGFPSVFAYSPTYTGFSADPNGTAVFRIEGNIVMVQFNSSSGTSNATGFTVTAPVTANASSKVCYNTCQVINSGALSTAPGLCQIINNQTTFSLFRDWSGLAWTNSGSKYANFSISYLL